MKKFLVSLTLVGLIALMSLASMAFVPGPASTKIHADANLCLDTEPDAFSEIITPTGAVVFATGEEHSGEITSSPDWTDIEGPLSINVVKEEAIFDFKFNTFRSHISGQLTAGKLTGSYSGTVSGSYTDPLHALDTIVESGAEVTWQIRDTELVATGKASAIFTESAGQFCGSLTFDGNKVQATNEF